MPVPTTPATPTTSAAPPSPRAGSSAVPSPAGRRLSPGRRVALVLTTVLAAILPTAWGITSLADLLTGTSPHARFYQVTGQGVLIAVLWLGAVVPLVLAGWRRRVPPATAGLAHLTIGFGAVVGAALAPGNGGAVAAVVVVVTGGLLWAALPVRPPLRAVMRRVEIDPLLAPLGLLVAALLTPYALTEASRQRTLHDEFAKASHYYDMAWLSLTVVALVLLAGVFVGARVLAERAAAALVVLGVAGLAFLSGAIWPAAALALGIALGLAAAVRRFRHGGIGANA